MSHAASLLVLGLLALTLAYLLLPYLHSERPLVSLGLLVSFPGGFGALVAGAAQFLAPPETTQP